MMRKMWVYILLSALVNDCYGPCYGCFEEEKIGLVEIKASFDPNGMELREWVDNKGDSGNCCEWNRIKCDNSTKRVIQLSLREVYDRSSGNWILNASLFLPFTELQSLDISSNGIVGCFDNEAGFQVLSPKLRKLEVLDLSGNHFNDSIISSLNEFSSLKSLYLSDNELTGSASLYGLRKLEALNLDGLNTNESILLNSLGALPSLKTLSLTGSHLSGTSVNQGTFFNSTTLEELFLGGTSFPTNILQNIGALHALRVLSFGDCDLNGPLPSKGWCDLKNLEQLDLSGNNLEGPLPSCLGNLSSLQLLDISRNQFTGNIASGPLTILISLKFLSLSDNHFEFPLSFQSFMNHSNLKFFSCDRNKLIFDKSPLQKFIPKFQLMFLSLSDSTSKPLNAEIPNFLYYQYDLRILDLSNNNLHGMYPWWLLANNTRLEELHLRKNSFVGPFKLQNHPTLYTSIIDISNNHILGQIPRNMCLIFPNLSNLRVANNGLTGSIPSCFGNMSSLQLLDVSGNGLSIVKLEQLKRLMFVKLSNNNLGGQISPSVFNSSAFLFLYLDGNNFTGRIPDFVPTRRGILFTLDMSNNQFSGMLPRWIGNISTLRAIDLSKNHFEGQVPIDFFNIDSLEYLDISENNLFGSVPSCINRPPGITHVHLSKNRLNGSLSNAFCNNSALVTLDLTYNNFMGPIPNWIGNLSALSVLLLKANRFDGELPIQLCLLQHLSILDVSQNKLYGPLPSCLGNFTLTEGSQKVFDYDPSFFLIKPRSDIFPEIMGPPLVGSFKNLLVSGYPGIIKEEVVEFTTKRMSYDYKGIILNLFSAIDLSSNNFSGEIPLEMGNLGEILALNLSHNNLTGSIPATFSNLKQIESLDLSYNNLNGGIPPQLTEVTTLAVFTVAYNNLSGKTPERKNQFGTFDESSYEGNPLLCGPPLLRNCSPEESPSKPKPNDEQEDDGLIDMDVFYVSFGVCYTIVVLAIAVVLYINPYWRRRWFHFIEEFIDTCYCFVVISFRKLSNFRRS